MSNPSPWHRCRRPLHRLILRPCPAGEIIVFSSRACRSATPVVAKPQRQPEYAGSSFQVALNRLETLP